MSRVVVALLARTREKTHEMEFLLVQSDRDFGTYTDHWYPPSGHVEPGESDTHALQRELQEELGIDIEPVRCLYEDEGDMENMRAYYWECRLRSGAPAPAAEIKDCGWFTLAEMTNAQLWPATRAFFEHVRQSGGLSGLRGSA